MLIPLAILLQLGATAPRWRVEERATVAWRPDAPAYTILVEESVPRARETDPDHRIRVRVPGRPDFVVVDDRGPGGFVPVREALRFADSGLISRDLPDSTRVLLLPVTARTRVLAAFGYAYASDPFQLVLLGLDASGNPKLLFRGDFDLKALTDLDGDGRPELIGRPTLPQGVGKCAATYDPYAVYRLGRRPGARPSYNLALSRRYNESHYVWAGPRMSEEVEVRGCPPGKLELIDHRKH